MKQQSLSDIMVSSERANNHAILQKEIQEPRLVATRNKVKDAFKKTDEDKTLLANLKKQLPKTKNHKFVTYLKATF